jgi:hypothetical protein
VLPVRDIAVNDLKQTKQSQKRKIKNLISQRAVGGENGVSGASELHGVGDERKTHKTNGVREEARPSCRRNDERTCHRSAAKSKSQGRNVLDRGRGSWGRGPRTHMTMSRKVHTGRETCVRMKRRVNTWNYNRADMRMHGRRVTMVTNTNNRSRGVDIDGEDGRIVLDIIVIKRNGLRTARKVVENARKVWQIINNNRRRGRGTRDRRDSIDTTMNSGNIRRTGSGVDGIHQARR